MTQHSPQAISNGVVSALTVLWCGALIMTLSLGVRHSFGMFLQPMSLDNGWGREVFAFSIALQNLVWGVIQPLVGRMADKHGAARTMIMGGFFYALGLWVMSTATTPLMMAIGAGVLIGIGLSGTTFPVVFGAVSRAMPPEKRSMAMGVSMALGSLGQFAFLPIGSWLINTSGWSQALVVMALCVVVILPLALPLLKAPNDYGKPDSSNAPVQSMGQAMQEAIQNRGFQLLALSYFVCGFQVIFINVHLPAYIQDRGISATAGSHALALIGLFNILGSYLAGYWGGRYRKTSLLTGIYALRAVLILAFISLPLTEWSVYVFAAGMGVIWLSTVPLTTGTVSAMFGVSNLAMLSGLVFMFHQIGAFLGGWVGGKLFDLTGSYTLVWWISIALSIIAAIATWPVQERSIRLNNTALT